jgi:hypothetical protein
MDHQKQNQKRPTKRKFTLQCLILHKSNNLHNSSNFFTLYFQYDSQFSRWDTVLNTYYERAHDTFNDTTSKGHDGVTLTTECCALNGDLLQLKFINTYATLHQFLASSTVCLTRYCIKTHLHTQQNPIRYNTDSSQYVTRNIHVS